MTSGSIIHIEALLVHGRTTCIHKLTRYTMTWTWGSHHLPPLYNIFYDSSQRLHPNGIFPRTPKLKFPKFSKLRFLPFCTPIFFLCKPLIKTKSQEKLLPSSKPFERYLAHPLHIHKSRRFLTFNGRGSNWHLESWPFF
jgi:hypothetical protein